MKELVSGESGGGYPKDVEKCERYDKNSYCYIECIGKPLFY